MESYFDSEIKRLEKELTTLKTAVVRSAGVITLHPVVLNIDVELEMEDFPPPEKITYIKIKPKSNDTMYFVTLDKYYGDDLGPGKTEFMYYRHQYADIRETADGLVIRLVCIGDLDDAQTIQQGGKVIIPVELTVYGTDYFELEVI